MPNELTIPKELEALLPKVSGSTSSEFLDHQDEARLVVVEQVSHHRKNESEPYVFTSRYSKFLTNKREQTFDREPVEVGEEWKSLVDFGGWIKKCSQLLIENREGTSQINLTKKQQQEIASRVVDVKFGENGDLLEILPGESMRVRPTTLSSVYLKCRSGIANLRIGIVPE